MSSVQSRGLLLRPCTPGEDSRRPAAPVCYSAIGAAGFKFSTGGTTHQRTGPRKKVTFVRVGSVLHVALILMCLPLVGCGLSQGHSQAQNQSAALSRGDAFFGMNQSHLVGCNSGDWAFPLFSAPAGSIRAFATCRTTWAQMNPANNSFDFSGLDMLLSTLKSGGIDDVFLTLGYVPNWISSNPTDPLCDGANQHYLSPGMCDPPVDLNADGTGTDLAWRNFLTALLNHVASSSYRSTHAHIQYYEIWDEFHRSDTVNTATCYPPGDSAGQPCSYRGTFAQMLRMTQDLRCIVEGHSNDPITATLSTCGTSGYSAIGLDVSALIMEGDAGGGSLDNGAVTLQNYLYCNSSPPAGSECNYGSAGSAATDVISGHPYFSLGEIPERTIKYVAAEKALLSPVDAAKPYFAGEGSWGKNNTASIPDPGLHGAYVARWYLALLIAGVQRGYWFAWDEFQADGAGGLWAPTSLTFPFMQCTTPDPVGGYTCTGGIAYAQIADWLSGATVASFNCPGTCSRPVSGIFTVNITRSGGYEAQIAWDSSATSPCLNPQCGATAFTAPSFATQWRDLAGNTYNGQPTAIGAAPIITENASAP